MRSTETCDVYFTITLECEEALARYTKGLEETDPGPREVPSNLL
jgi:hypothetical protein